LTAVPLQTLLALACAADQFMATVCSHLQMKDEHSLKLQAD